MLEAARKSQWRVVAVTYEQIVLLDLAGPCEVFSMANRIVRALRPGASAPYSIEIVSAGEDLRCEAASGLTMVARHALADVGGDIDTLLIPGGMDLSLATGNGVLLEWLRKMAPRVRRLGSICTGAFVLAAAGLLEGRSATTHWQDCGNLAREYPGIRVEPDRIFVKDGNVYTSAGVTAGMDLALAMVEEDLGRQVALRVARTLVMFVRRPGGQSQFSAVLESQAAERQPLRDLLVWAAEHPGEDLSVEALAARVNMSVRNFSRAFRRDIGNTPGRYVEMLRVEAARRKLEETDDSLERIAQECGVAGGDSLRRVFLRVLGVSPGGYRERFR